MQTGWEKQLPDRWQAGDTRGGESGPILGHVRERRVVGPTGSPHESTSLHPPNVSSEKTLRMIKKIVRENEKSADNGSLYSISSCKSRCGNSGYKFTPTLRAAKSATSNYNCVSERHLQEKILQTTFQIPPFLKECLYPDGPVAAALILVK